MYIDLDTKTMSNNHKILLENGIPKNQYDIPNTIITYTDLEILYKIYKYSIPNKKNRKQSYFKALPYDQLSLNDLINGIPREKAENNLKLAILTGILNHSLIWPNNSHWFWQSNTDKDFILLRKWFI